MGLHLNQAHTPGSICFLVDQNIPEPTKTQMWIIYIQAREHHLNRTIAVPDEDAGHPPARRLQRATLNIAGGAQ